MVSVLQDINGDDAGVRVLRRLHFRGWGLDVTEHDGMLCEVARVVVKHSAVLIDEFLELGAVKESCGDATGDGYMATLDCLSEGGVGFDDFKAGFLADGFLNRVEFLVESGEVVVTVSCCDHVSLLVICSQSVRIGLLVLNLLVIL